MLNDYTPHGVNLRDFDALPGDLADNADAFDRALSALPPDEKATLHVPDGVFETSRPIVLRHQHSLAMAPSATIKATESFKGDAVVIKAGEEHPEGVARHRYGGRIFGGTIDASEVPGVTGVLVVNACRCAIHDLEIVNASQCGLHLGTEGWYEGTLYNVRISRALDAPGIAGSVGLRIETCSDNHVSQVVVIAYETGVWATGSSTAFSQVHCWHGGPGNPMKVGYLAAGWQDFYSQCHADCPSEAGFKVTAPFQRFIGCMVQGGGPKVAGFQLAEGGTHGTYLGSYLLGRLSKPADLGPELIGFTGNLEGATILGSLYNKEVVDGKLNQVASGTGGTSFIPVAGFDGQGMRLPTTAAAPTEAEGDVGELRYLEVDGEPALHLKTSQGWKHIRLG